MDKAPDAFRTISEVADELDVPQHVLRFWETRFSQIRPMKRGGGRRYYRPDDLDLLRGIRHLLYGEGYTIRGVQRILREQGVKVVQTVWQAGAAQPPRHQTDETDGEGEAAEVADAARPALGLAARRDSVEPAKAEEPEHDEEEDGEEEDSEEEDSEEEEEEDGDEDGEDADDEEAEEGDEADEDAEDSDDDDEKPAKPQAALQSAPGRKVEPSFGPSPARPVQAMRAVQPVRGAQPVAPPVGLSRDTLSRLQASLHELSECRRLLDEAMGEGLP